MREFEFYEFVFVQFIGVGEISSEDLEDDFRDLSFSCLVFYSC